MFDLELAWDRPAHTGSYAAEHVLRIRVKPGQTATGGTTLPVRMAIALDNSGSMEGEKLKSAKEACAAVVGQLRPQDSVRVSAFASKLVPVIAGVSGDSTARASAEAALAPLTAEGVTRTDQALEWIEQALPADPGTVRVGILITDGHATGPRGNILGDVKFLVERAGQLGSKGIALFTVGLGSADDFNVAFLDDLSKGARGAYLYAHEPSELEQQLAGRLGSCQTMAIEGATLSLRPLLNDVQLKGLCRIRPDFVPMDVGNFIKIGNLRADVPTDFLVSVMIPPKRLDQPPGSLPVLAVSLESRDAGSAPQQAAIEYTVAFSRAQQVNSEVNQDRLTWDINSYADALNRTTDPNKTGELLTSLGATAQKAGHGGLAQQAFQQLDQLRKSGQLSGHSRSQVLAQSRNLGGNA